MKGKKFWVFCFAILFLASWAFASFPSRGTCEILENRQEVPANCFGNILRIDKSVDSFDVLEVPEGVNKPAFAEFQFNINSRGQGVNENQFFVQFNEGGTYRLLADGDEIVIRFQEPQGVYSLQNLLVTVLLAFAIAALSIGLFIFKNKNKPKSMLLIALLWIAALILLLIEINPL